MASKSKIEFIDEGFRGILSADGTQSMIQMVADDIASRAGNGFEAEVSYFGAGHRWMGFVHSTDRKSMIAESEHKQLTKAVR